MIEVKNADTSYIPVIRSLAIISWQSAYKEILSASQMDYMLKLNYSEAALQKQIQEQHQQFIIASDKIEAVGFASYSIKNAEEPTVFRLHKIYINPCQQGNGIGKILLAHIISDIKPKGATSLELNVNRYNTALHFYLKAGFEIIKEEDIDIGAGYFMNDYLMKLSL